MSGLRILWTMPYLPWPITSGGKARQFNLIKQMAQRGHAITLLVQSKTPLDAATQAALAPLLSQFIVLPRRPLKHPVTLWHAATSRMPVLSSINAYAPAWCARFEALLTQGHWDVVHIEHSYGFAPFEAVLQRHQHPFVITEHNVESNLGAATYGKWPWWARPLARFDQWRAERWERHVLRQASAVLAVTPQDAQALARISGGRPVSVVPNGVDTRAFAQVQPKPEACTVLFVGNFDYAPNVDGLEWALTAIFPRLWARLPQARLMVCGHALDARWQTRFTDTRIDWHGYVEHLPTAQSQASVFIAPLRFGGGSKLKVLEAMAAALPVVSTSEGLSGLDAQHGVHALVADEPEAMAQALERLLRQPDEAGAMGQRAREMVSARFDWQASARELERAYQSLNDGQEAA